MNKGQAFKRAKKMAQDIAARSDGNGKAWVYYDLSEKEYIASTQEENELGLIFIDYLTVGYEDTECSNCGHPKSKHYKGKGICECEVGEKTCLCRRFKLPEPSKV